MYEQHLVRQIFARKPPKLTFLQYLGSLPRPFFERVLAVLKAS